MNSFLLSIILIPIIEIYLLIKIGSKIGALTTIILIFTTAFVGIYYAKYEGLNTLKSGFTQLSRNETPTYEVVSGAAIAFGAFFSTTTKKVKIKASTKILNKVKKLTKTPIVAIGGINFNNYKKLLLNNANLLAISSYVWNNKKYKPLETIEKLK